MSLKEDGQSGTRRHREFSPLEAAIWNASTDQWQSASELAAQTGQKVGHCFYAILGNLVDREYLESSRNGYRRLPE